MLGCHGIQDTGNESARTPDHPADTSHESVVTPHHMVDMSHESAVTPDIQNETPRGKQMTLYTQSQLHILDPR